MKNRRRQAVADETNDSPEALPHKVSLLLSTVSGQKVEIRFYDVQGHLIFKSQLATMLDIKIHCLLQLLTYGYSHWDEQSHQDDIATFS